MALDEGRVPLIHETPHPNVCRTCGHLTLAEPATQCPRCGAWPSTYQRFMPVYWLDALEPLAALAKLRQTPVAVAALLAGLPEESHGPSAAGWRLGHPERRSTPARCAGRARFSTRFVREAEHPILEAKAVWSWATNEAERPPTTLEIFETYKTSPVATLVKLEILPLADWWRTGQHQEFGIVTLRQQVSYLLRTRSPISRRSSYCVVNRGARMSDPADPTTATARRESVRVSCRNGPAFRALRGSRR